MVGQGGQARQRAGTIGRQSRADGRLEGRPVTRLYRSVSQSSPPHWRMIPPDLASEFRFLVPVCILKPQFPVAGFWFPFLDSDRGPLLRLPFALASDSGFRSLFQLPVRTLAESLSGSRLVG